MTTPFPLARLRLLALLPLAACSAMSPSATGPVPSLPAERFVLTGAAPAIYDLAGQVRVEPGTGPDIVVTVTRAGGDAAVLQATRQPRPSGDALWIRASTRRLLYPALPGSADSLQLRATGGGLEAGKGGFLGFFTSRQATTITRRPGGPTADAHADIVVALPPGRRLDVQLGGGLLRVGAVGGELHGLVLDGSIEASNPGGQVTLASGSGVITVSGGSGRLQLRAQRGGIDVSGFRGEALDASTGAGAISLAGVSATVLSLHTGAGDVAVDGARAVRLDVQAGAGEVRLGDIVADTLLARTGVGALALTGARAASATLIARKGNAEARLLSVPAALLLRADGAAALVLPPGADADLALKSDHGRLTLETAASSRSGSGRQLSARLGRGGPRIEVRAEHDVTVSEGDIAAVPAATRDRP